MGRMLITGATGFIGSHASERALTEGRSLTLLCRRRTVLIDRFEREGARVVSGDLHDEGALLKAVEDVDTVLHLAAATTAFSRGAMMRTNVEGTEKLLRACDGRGIYIVHFSSQAAAGPSLPRAKTNENSPCAPLTWYGESKHRSEEAVQLWSERPDNHASILRPSVVYGPGDRALLPSFRLISLGIAPVLGDGSNRFSLIHVGDVVTAAFHLLKHRAFSPGAALYFVAGDEALTWVELSQAIAAAVGREKVRLVKLPRSLFTVATWGAEVLGHIRGRPSMLSRQKLIELRQPCWCCSAEKLQQTGWRPAWSLAEGMMETVQWYREQRWLRPR